MVFLAWREEIRQQSCGTMRDTQDLSRQATGVHDEKQAKAEKERWLRSITISSRKETKPTVRYSKVKAAVLPGSNLPPLLPRLGDRNRSDFAGECY